MPWWFRTIFWALLACFLAGLFLGLSVWWWRRRKDLAELDRRRLEAEAESDRLRLRMSSLKEHEQRATLLEEQLAAAQEELSRLSPVERE